MSRDDDVNTCRDVGETGVAILTLLILGLCVAILVWA
jgi:hypothetical protein